MTPEICCVLTRTMGPVNLGLAARACRNLGVDRLRLVRPGCAIDCDETRMFANHAIDFLRSASVCEELEAAVADCGLVIGTTARRRARRHGPVYALEDLPHLLADRPSERVALVFGNEADGLDARELRRCHHLLRLATPGDYASYNLSHAVAIALYHLRGLRTPADPPAEERAADQAVLEGLLDYWLATLDRFGYFRRADRARYAPKLRRLINDLGLKRKDVEIFYGMLAQFHYRCFGDKGHHLLAGKPEPTPRDRAR